MESTLAKACATVLTRLGAAKNEEEWWVRHTGLYHLTAQGHTTWHGVIKAILEQVHLTWLPMLTPTPSKDYLDPEKRPSNSVMSCRRFKESFCKLPAWDQALTLCMEK